MDMLALLYRDNFQENKKTEIFLLDNNF